MPTLFAKIVKNVTPIDEFSEGLFSGKEEYELEYSKIQADDLRNLRYKSQSRDKGHERE
ncbi:MAG TPA: hypothetical protein VKC54_03565 [Patescibacteria group bacterium]|nr:hypothetical protein [Patescibacteria group bacterium]